MVNKLFYIFGVLILLLSAFSCVDDKLYDPEGIGEGMANVTADISFDNLTPALTRSTSGGTSGTAINNLSSICVLLYKTDGSILKDPDGQPRKFYFNDVHSEISGQDIPSDQVDPNHPENGHWAQSEETSTVNATVNLTDIPYGKYRMYAIANVPENVFTDEVISDIEKVRNLHFAWDKEDISSNNQMFGYFSDDNSSDGFEAPFVVIKQPDQSLHAWVRRLASKVTIAFDASNLKENVNIYLVSATIKDIPANCYLGKDNSPGKYSPSNNEMNNLIKDSEQKIWYVNDADGTPLESWPALINKENPIFGFNADAINSSTLSLDDKLKAQHGENVNALYFYENLQGTGEKGKASDKWQVVEGSSDTSKPSYPDGNTPPDGTDATDPSVTGYKDNKIKGSYIEVKAYYISNNPNDVSRGNITYRFMLGKDTHLDFNAARNHHFKVTLCFNGYANDVDWHIDFDQDPAIVGTTPNYISYLYNHSMNYTFDVVGGELISLVARINDNDITKGSWHPMDGEVTSKDEAVANQLGGSVYWTGDVYNPGPWNGFLSLRKSTVAEYGGDNYTNKAVFNDTKYQLGFRGYDVSEGTRGEPEGGAYTIKKSGYGITTVTLPLFTRPRVMVASTGYTGNNPYVAYNRESQVEFTARVRKSDGSEYELKDTIQVIQSRRIVNPKAVWREASSTSSFHVQLKIMESQTSESFSNLISFGPWKAEVVVGKDWINLTPSNNSIKNNVDGSISGKGNQYDDSNRAGRKIDFYLAPKSTTTTPRGGIIRVTYHNNSCVHNIFVRQGYDPVEFYNTGTFWHTGNLLTGGSDSENAVEVSAPQYEGSYFRLYNRQYPIDANSNTVPTPFEVINGIDKYFNIAGTSPQEQKKWREIKTQATSWGDFMVNDVSCRFPKKADWEAIIKEPTTIYGYGVLYGNEATETKENITEAYGANPDHPEYGMRGVIVCDEKSGTQIFLPIAASGYGRFKQYTSNNTGLPSGYGGSVLYATRYTWYPTDNVKYRPLFYDIFLSPGTLYWLYDSGTGLNETIYKSNFTLDINYFTFGFSVTSWYDAQVQPRWPDPSGSDAIHIRLVHDKP